MRPLLVPTALLFVLSAFGLVLGCEREGQNGDSQGLTRPLADPNGEFGPYRPPEPEKAPFVNRINPEEPAEEAAVDPEAVAATEGEGQEGEVPEDQAEEEEAEPTHDADGRRFVNVGVQQSPEALAAQAAAQAAENERAAQAAAQAAARAAAEPERDLNEELRGKLGGVASCLPRQNGRDVRISVSARVAASGRITSASVSGAPTPEAADCIEAQVLRTQLANRVPNAPQSASASFEFRFTPTKQ